MDGHTPRFLTRQIYARPLAVFSVSFLIGLLLAFEFRTSVPFCIVCGVISLAAYFMLPVPKYRKAALAMLFPLFLGMARMSVEMDVFPSVQEQYSASIKGRIVSEPYTNPDTGRVISRFRLEEINGETADMTVRLYLRGDAELLRQVEYGQRLSTIAHIWTADPVTNPHEFDFGLYLQRSGMPAYATAKIEDTQILDSKHNLRSVIIQTRHILSEHIDLLFPENAALARALILGDRTQLSEEQRESLNKTGIAHLIAISGLHITSLGMLLFLVLKGLFRRNTALCLSMAFLVLYGCVIGFTPSFLRALIMFAVFSFAPVLGYHSDGITRLCAAMLPMLLWKPLNILDAGFVLSFSASAGIILLSPPLQALFGIEPLLHLNPYPHPFLQLLRNGALYFPKLLCASTAAQLATLPAVIAYFGTQSLVSIPVNLICVPICMWGYYIALAALILSFLWMPLGIIPHLADMLFSAMLAAADCAAALPFAVVRIGRYPVFLVLLHAAIILASSNLSRIKKHLRRFMPLTLIIIAGLSSLLVHISGLGFSITFLDADQADCAVIRTQGRTYLMDAGDTYTPAADYLSATCLKLDGIFLSHPHQDHAGGLEDILTAFAPEAIYVPVGWHAQDNISLAILDGMELAHSMNIPIIEIAAGDAIPLSADTLLTVHAPSSYNPDMDVNDISLLASVTLQSKTVLFTGDLSKEGEPAEIPDADILKVAHHGSDKASSIRFIESVSPEIAVISVGENNFGHPAEETLANLSASGARILRTDHSGAITLRLKPDDTWQIETYLPLEEKNDME